jgi:hypothetical protein
MIDVLRKIFEANPGKSTIVVNGKCSDCGRKVIVEIKPTSGGYGLMGGVLVKCSPRRYLTKCADCYKFNPKIIEQYKSTCTSTR